MSRLGRVVRGLLTRPPRELAGRASQALAARLERHGWGDPASDATGEGLIRASAASGVTDADDLLTRFRTRVDGSSLPIFSDAGASRAALAAGWPELNAEVQARGRDIDAGRFDVLGFPALEFGDPINWHLDPTSGRVAPDVHWSRVPYLDPDRVGDHKVIWELNRHRHFVELGQAYWVTGDERWAELLMARFSEWLSANPPKRGINWASSLEVGFRAIAWLWALHFIAHSPRLSASAFADIVASLRLHGRHVERYISTYFSPNTHLTGEALALVYLGTVLPELPESARWRARGRAWFMDAMSAHIRPDGGYFEQSTHYHRYTSDFLIHLMLLDRIGGRQDDALRRVATSALEHLVAVTRPDGHIPLVGDDDAGRLLFLEDRPVADVRPTILAGAVMLDRPDWLVPGGAASPEPLWLLGPEAKTWLETRQPAAPSYASNAARDTGFYVMRSGWEPDADFAFLRSGPHGALSGGHAHADALSLELVLGGRPVFVDPGTARYMDADLRDAFRSTAVHNTVSCGGRSSAEPAGPFGWAHKTNSRVDEWIVASDYDFVQGRHDGYARLWPGVRHERSVLRADRDYWVIRDVVSGAGREVGESRVHFQFAIGLEIDGVEGARLFVRDPERGTRYGLHTLVGGGWSTGTGRVSPKYGAIVDAPIAAYQLEPGDAVAESITIVSEEPVLVEPLAAEGGRAWRVAERDLLVFGDGPTRVETPDGVVETDFGTLWHRPDTKDGAGSLLAVGGRRLSLAPRAALELPEPVRYVSAPTGGEPEVAPTGDAEPGSGALRDTVSDWWRRG